jgi:hypothetical protein
MPPFNDSDYHNYALQVNEYSMEIMKRQIPCISARLAPKLYQRIIGSFVRRHFVKGDCI